VSGIHDPILSRLEESLSQALIESVPEEDPARVGAIKVGPLQGEPDPDVARISIELYYNDPDQAIGGSGIGQSPDPWDDQVEEIEIGTTITWRRRFTAKVRCLLESTQEDLAATRAIVSTVRSRLERALLQAKFAGVATADEYVSRGVLSENIRAIVAQSGGPGAYDYHIKLRFEVLTTESVGGDQ
jgi:hypothetical protein